MKTTTLPNTEITVSALAFGCWGITSDFHWGSRDEEESLAAMYAALDAGVNFFDTAEAYGDGNSEKLLAKVADGRRDKMVIASKVKADSMHPNEIPKACERSLKRLETDYIDLYQTHWTDPKIPAADSWGAMLRLKEQGKVRAVGVCNMGVGHLSEVCAQEKPVTNQLPYNLLWRCIEHETLPTCREQEIGVLVYSPLMHGLLADKYQSAAEVPDGRARSRHFNAERKLARHGEAGCEEEAFAAISSIREVCRSLNRTMADVALAWLAAQNGLSSVIVGVRNKDQLAENTLTLENQLPNDAVQKLNQATDALNVALGPNADMWQGASGSRFR